MTPASALRARFDRWLRARHPRLRQVTLTQKTIYILPTAAGGVYLLLCGLILLLAINYQNNLAYGVCFTLISVFITAIVHSYANLSGLQIQALSSPAVFAGELAQRRFQLSSGRDRHQLQVNFADQSGDYHDLRAGQTYPLVLTQPTRQRGWLEAPWLKVTSRYPFGLFRSWSWLQVEQPLLVYPHPVADQLEQSGGAGVPDQGRQPLADEQEFESLVRYSHSSPANRIAWRNFAKTGQLLVRRYRADSASDQLWLSPHCWPQLPLEAQLSRICYWCVQLGREGRVFGVRLDENDVIAPASGAAHQHQVLQLLACYRLNPHAY